jgi:Ca2+/Na+ antiporter
MASDMGGLIVIYTLPIGLIIWIMAMSVNMTTRYKLSIKIIIAYCFIALGLNIYVFSVTSNEEARLLQTLITFGFIMPFLRWCFTSKNKSAESSIRFSLVINPAKLSKPNSEINLTIPQKLQLVSEGKIDYKGFEYDKNDNMIIYLSAVDLSQEIIIQQLNQTLELIYLEKSAVEFCFNQ